HFLQSRHFDAWFAKPSVGERADPVRVMFRKTRLWRSFVITGQFAVICAKLPAHLNREVPPMAIRRMKAVLICALAALGALPRREKATPLATWRAHYRIG